jgi:hypothetical protein
METGDEGQQSQSAVAELSSLQGSIEATLSFTQGVEETDHIAMQLFGGVHRRG